jgi:Holliday junction resolvase RusA-like endonuclease
MNWHIEPPSLVVTEDPPLGIVLLSENPRNGGTLTARVPDDSFVAPVFGSWHPTQDALAEFTSSAGCLRTGRQRSAALMAGLSFDEIVHGLRALNVPLERAEAAARLQLGLPTPASTSPIREELRLPASVTLPWSLLVSDNEKCEAKGEKHMLKTRYRQAKAAIPERVRQQLGNVAPTHQPLQLIARVYVPDNRTHDVCNFAKLVHDALQGVMYTNDSLLWDTRWQRVGVDVDRPRAEVTIYPAVP